MQDGCRDSVEALLWVGAPVSMSRKGSACDNAKAQSFFGTLKMEEVSLQDQATFEEAEACLGAFIEEVYDVKRLHWALGYRPPTEFENLILAGLKP